MEGEVVKQNTMCDEVAMIYLLIRLTLIFAAIVAARQDSLTDVTNVPGEGKSGFQCEPSILRVTLIKGWCVAVFHANSLPVVKDIISTK